MTFTSAAHYLRVGRGITRFGTLTRVAVGVVLLPLHGGLALAQSQQLLNWEAPAECPQRDEVLAAVREIAGDDVLATTTLHATGHIGEVKGKFRLDLQIEGDRGTYTRTLTARDCRDLLNAAAVVLGLNLKRMAQAEPSSSEGSGSSSDASPTGSPNQTSSASADNNPEAPPSAAPAPAAPPAQVAPPTPTQSPKASPEQSGPPSWWVGLPQAQGAIGALPVATLWLSASIGKRWQPWMFWVSGRYHLPERLPSEALSDVGVQVSRYGGELGIARGWRWTDFELAPGIALGLERLTVRGTGQNLVAGEASGVVPLIGASLTGRWLATEWLDAALAVGVDVPTSRPRFVVPGVGDQGQLGAVVARLSLGLEWNF